MHPFRNAANSSSNGTNETLLNLLLRGSGARANPCFGPGIGVAATDQMHEFLRSRFGAAATIAALLRHCTAHPGPLCFLGI
jgi:hypothetical protein